MTPYRSLLTTSTIFFFGLICNSESYSQERYPLPFPPNIDVIIKKYAESLSNVTSNPLGPVTDLEAISAINTKRIVYQIESICGNIDDSQDVELYDGALGPSVEFVKLHEPSTAQIQWNNDIAQKYAGQNADAGNVSGVRWCTGTMISENNMITAGHCFDQDGGGWLRPKRLHNGVWEVIPSKEIAQNMHVNFKYQVDSATHSLREPIEFPVEDLLEYRSGGLDYAIIKLGNGNGGEIPGSVFGYRKTSPSMPSAGGLLTIIQHPAGRPKKVEAGPLSLISDGFLQYGDLDTLGGSSGSGVLDTSGNIVGIHVLGGCTAFGAGYNKAVTISDISSVSDIL
ncbi:V8-like Glu-specific endopeptidase [Rhizobium leguminosarum]|uniref:trypsin-like serine peptidase n=1 Tax=Rhizobium leguminosarum TaxID=384 RepID=UPI0016198E64|nr:trypsin-like peptidase domain-containing protein [Rhizobium leguminosarum]MBB4590468.1 V8-like Glu-specific endopeptidase [Rhizobium leguminosarum]